MTSKLTITDERIEKIAVWLATESHSLNLEMLTCLRELQERRKAERDSEPVGYFGRFDPDDEDLIDQCSKNVKGAFPLYRHAQQVPTCEPITVTDDMAYAFHHALTDSMIGADDVEEIKTGLRAVFANLTAPVVSAEYPYRLPCSVLLEPGLRFGKGIKTSTVLAALARRAVYESDMAALSPEERAEFQARIEDFKALIAQPAPVVVPDGLRLALSNAGIAAPESDEMLAATCEKHIQALVTWVKERKPLHSAPVVPDEMLCEFYEVANWPDLVRELVKHVEQLQDSAKRNVKPWEDTFPETLLPAYIERVEQADKACRTALLQAGNSPVIPEGYVMVPKLVTPEIGNAINEVGHHCTCGNCSQRLWDLLLAAAPQEVNHG
ncbi:hypothetical protein ABN147_07395 [Klebsiella oxytoca]|uniref:hypothetical protein n=1 Tax=Klebsiella oxytoca TaxID=571 RepID=UPI0032D9F078